MRVEKVTEVVGVEPMALDTEPETVLVGGDETVDPAIEDAISTARHRYCCAKRRTWSVEDWEIDVESDLGLTFMALDDTLETAGLEPNDLSFLYDAIDDWVGFVADSYLEDEMKSLVHPFPARALAGKSDEWSSEHRPPVDSTTATGVYTSLNSSSRVDSEPIRRSMDYSVNSLTCSHPPIFELFPLYTRT